MGTNEIRVVVMPSQRGETSECVDWLERQFEEEGELLRGAVRKVPRAEQEPTLGVIDDLLINLGVSVSVQIADYLVRFLASRLSSQPDTDLMVEIQWEGQRLRIRASGMTPERLREIEARFREWMQLPPHED